MPVDEFTHAQLCERACRWLMNGGGCSWAVCEPNWRSPGCTEQPDAFGVRMRRLLETTLVECKRSRSDFFADRDKTFRRFPETGLGKFRYYLAPKGLLSRADLPPFWGLLEVSGRQCRVTVTAQPQAHNAAREAHLSWFLLAKLERRAPRLSAQYRLPVWTNETVTALREKATPPPDLRGGP